jgi:hypothetical protein
VARSRSSPRRPRLAPQPPKSFLYALALQICLSIVQTGRCFPASNHQFTLGEGFFSWSASALFLVRFPRRGANRYRRIPSHRKHFNSHAISIRASFLAVNGKKSQIVGAQSSPRLFFASCRSNTAQLSPRIFSYVILTGGLEDLLERSPCRFADHFTPFSRFARDS